MGGRFAAPSPTGRVNASSAFDDTARAFPVRYPLLTDPSPENTPGGQGT